MREGEPPQQTAGRGLVLPWIVAGMLGWTVSGAWGGLTVMQVESPEASGAYAPVSFQESRVVVDGGAGYAGIRFIADSAVSPGIGAGGHATGVGGRFYGVSSPGYPYVGEVRVLKTDDLLSGYLRPTRRGRVQKAPLVLPGRPKVLNASFAGSTGSLALDADLVRRTDLMAARDGVVMVAGAVTAPSGAFEDAVLIWGGWNVLAVRGSAEESVFDPSQNGVGRAYANVWAAGTASLATGAVSSMATALLGQAAGTGIGKAAKPPLVRALLMAGADRATRPDGVEAWRAELPNGLDRDLGAGEASLTNSERILRGGLLTLKAAKPSKTGQFTGKTNGAAKSDAGVGSVLIQGRQAAVSCFEVEDANSGLTATLTWDTSIKTGEAGDMRLELREVLPGGAGGKWVTGDLIASVDADADNIRHMVLPTGLEPGTYAWVIRNESKISLQAGFAFQMEAPTRAVALNVPQGLPPAAFLSPPTLPVPTIPEPSGTLVTTFFAGRLLLRRRSSIPFICHPGLTRSGPERR